MEWPKTYYISQGNTSEEHLNNIKNACKSGVKLVQLRMKKFNEKTALKTAEIALEICESHGALLFINDHVELASQIGAHGVHLGKSDQSPSAARKILPEGTLIGGTANTLADCEYLMEQQVNYIGLGPFRFTRTKVNLDPIVSRNEYQKICAKIKDSGKSIPVYAIGGILQNDVTKIYQTGVHGVAISGALSNAKSEQNLKEFKELVDFCETDISWKKRTNPLPIKH